VDYDENIQQDADDNKTYEEDLIKDQQEQANPNQHREDEGQGNDEYGEEEEQSDDNANAVISQQETNSQGSELRQSARESRPVPRLKPNMSGKLYVQNNKKTIKKVVFAEDVLSQPGVASETN
jgi:hypothetical protein